MYDLLEDIPLSEDLNKDLNRRTFLRRALCGGLAAGCPALAFSAMDNSVFPEAWRKFIIEARYYEKLPHKKIRCLLCPRECVIDDRERGYCGVRENREGIYYSLVYARPCTYHVDPIEKKPLFHFFPGSLSFSIATAGCNVNCKFCQNWQISQVRPEQIRSMYMPPKQVADMAQKHSCISIAYTYSEPIIFYEYMEDTALAGIDADIRSVVITGGYIQKDPLKRLCKSVDAIKVDLKAFSEQYYRDIVNGELKPVLDALVTIREMNVWTEIVYLVVPTLNDSEHEIKGLCKWIKSNLGSEVPVHFTRFHPQYLLKNLPPTPLETLERAKQIADAEGLQYAYIGNIPGHPAENTYCPDCKNIVIKRTGFTVHELHLDKGTCTHCGYSIAGVWD